MYKPLQLFKTLVPLLIIVVCFAGYLPPGQDDAIPVKGYDLVWHDEFNGNKLNRNKWNYRGLGKRGDSYKTKEAISLDGDGHLIIEASCRNDSVFTGMIATENIFETTYGYFECRASLATTPGIFPAFWLQSRLNQDNGTPEFNGVELDIFEYFPHAKKDYVAHTLHWGGYGASHKVFGPVWGMLRPSRDNYHRFGLLWTPENYVTYVDGIKTYTGNTLISKVPEFILLSMGADKNTAGPLNKESLPDSFKIDYVRVYKRR